jgi:hypothetical protein
MVSQYWTGDGEEEQRNAEKQALVAVCQVSEETSNFFVVLLLTGSVRVVTVTLTRFQTSKVLPPFVKLLNALPNVHTLEIPHAHSAMTGALKEAFEGSVFPTVQKIILPTCAHEILRCCPEIREVTCNEDDGGRLVGALAHNGCKKLEVLRGVSPGPVLIKRKLLAYFFSTI